MSKRKPKIETRFAWPVYAAYARQRAANGSHMPPGTYIVTLVDGAAKSGAVLEVEVNRE